MTDTSELQKLLDSMRLPLSAIDTADYAEVFDEDGQKVALTVQPKILVAAVNAMPEYIEQQATISRLTAERAALVEALTPSGDTKAAYIGEIKFSYVQYDEFGDEQTVTRTLEWDTTKEVMAMIRARALVRDAEL